MKILLTTLHAKYIHSSLALPYLAAVCAGIKGMEIAVREFTVNEQSEHILRRMVGEAADIVAFSCYIWNIEQTLKLASDLKKVLPAVRIILGGPEVSHTPEEILIENAAIDCIIRGDGEKVFHDLLCGLKKSRNFEGALSSLDEGIAWRKGSELVITPVAAPLRDLDSVPSPFLAGLADIGKPLVYYETSRGCPFSCAFCMSSLASGVQSFSMERIRQDLLCLMEHEAATVKLVDRTFNYDARRAGEIWEFIITHNRSSRFHFEIAADLLTGENLTTLARVPGGQFRFEIGVQSGEADTLARVGRKTNLDSLFANVEKLVRETGVVIHLDLVAGLPGEKFSGFLASLQRLFDAAPHHIQVEPLKVLKGSPMKDIATREGYAWSAHPPYKILATPDLSFREICLIEDISRLVDIFYNSGRFKTVLASVGRREQLSAFFHDMAFFYGKRETDAPLSLRSTFELMRNFIDNRFDTETAPAVIDALRYDYCLCEYPSAGNLPSFLREEGEPVRPGKTAITRDEILKRFALEKGSKVRIFAGRFRMDYTILPWGEVETDITFIHVSAPGKGLHVIPVSDKSQDNRAKD